MPTNQAAPTTIRREGLEVSLERAAEGEPRTISAELIDCSRREIELLVRDDLEAEESVVIRVHDEQSGLRLDVTGVIGWRRNAPDGWTVGARFSQELDWESLGELFLCGILDATPRKVCRRVV